MNGKSHLKLRALCEGAIFVALAQILGYIKLFSLPNGGSITLNMLPIFIFCARWGFAPGMLASFSLSLLQLLLDEAFRALFGPDFFRERLPTRALYRRRRFSLYYIYEARNTLYDHCLYGAWIGRTVPPPIQRLFYRHGNRKSCKVCRCLCSGRCRLGRIYAGQLFRHDDDLAVDILSAL